MFAAISTVINRPAIRAIAALILLTQAAKAESEKLKFAFFASDLEFAYQGVVKPFVDAVNLEGKGIIEIDLYPSGVLGRSYAQQADLVLSGGADFAWVNPTLTPELFHDNTVLELPGLFRDGKEATQVFTLLTKTKTLQGYEDFFVIATLASSPLSIHTRVPTNSLGDLKGKRIRASNRTEYTVLKTLGMDPKSIPINEVADAINSGTIDGATAALEVLVDFGLSRFVTHHYMLDLGIVPLTVLMNRKKFDSLQPNAQAVIRKYSGDWTANHYPAAIDKYAGGIMEKLRADSRRNVVYPTPQDLAVARETFGAVVAQWADSEPRNRELLSIVQTEVAKLRSTR
ncbi:MAG: TRAP transporter substrate-binding protein DctP [Xanthobacteraceae bacterium]